MPSADPIPSMKGNMQEEKIAKTNRLVLCFDGTGNEYTGKSGDTNIVKLYRMFDRSSNQQYHYYQPGIGTYASGSDKVNVGPLGRISRWFSQLMDQGLGNTFDEHVLAGYKFLMRYYSQGDQIYIFGFSRGAFTARFLARMVATVGLLSKGNEEMVSFAYRSYQSYEQGTGGKTREEHEKFFEGFKETFCRDNVLVHFLGLFDTVRSVSTFDAPWVQPSYIPTYNSYATHVRHAVAVDERRSKFKPALLCEDHKLLNLDEEEDAEEQDSNAESEGSEDINAIPKEQKRGEDIKEVWFPGNHGDIGGGWPNPSGSEDGTVQLSALPLEWMVKELRAVPVKKDAGPIQLNHFADDFLKCIGSDSRRAEALTSTLHDVMNFSGGGSRFGVLFWTMMDWIPLFGRKELEDGKWVKKYWPPNMGGTRDIPESACLNRSVRERMAALSGYRPKNAGLQDAIKNPSVGTRPSASHM